MEKTIDTATQATVVDPKTMLLPLVLAQFLCSFAASSMNVAISSIAKDLGTTVSGVQTAITVFTLTMAALMIPGGKLTDIRGRKFCFRLGLLIYGIGALIAALSRGLPTLILGYSFGEGIGTALLIPPVYIFATVLFTDTKSRAAAFGAISAAAGIGSSAGPLIGGLITGTTSWRITFAVQTLIAIVIIILGNRIFDPGVQSKKPRLDLTGTLLSAAGLFFIVIGILTAGTYGWIRAGQDVVVGSTVVIPQGGISPLVVLVVIGAILLFFFFRHIRAWDRAGKEPLLAPRMFQNRTSNLGLITQNIQWLVLLGLSFVVSVFLQNVLGYGAIETGLVLTAATLGILISSLGAGRFASRRSQAFLIRWGFIITTAGLVFLLLLARVDNTVWTFLPGLFLVGFGVGVMITSSVNVVQSAWSEEDQGEISGLSRSVSNLGSSLGTAIAGTVIVSTLVTGNKGYALAVLVLTVIAAIGIIVAVMLPNKPPQEAGEA